jgi:hypothetical protein
MPLARVTIDTSFLDFPQLLSCPSKSTPKNLSRYFFADVVFRQPTEDGSDEANDCDGEKQPTEEADDSRSMPSEPLKGLCIDCKKRHTCRRPKPQGGVWRCEEYE